MYTPAEDSTLRVIQALGQGGTAQVVRAYHVPSGCEVAVKYARPEADISKIDFCRLSRREYDLIGGYHFPGLVRPILDPAPAYDHLTLEFCPGPTLDQIGRVEDLSLALNIVSAIALDLEFLHAARIIHGDLKPQNIFIPEHLFRHRSDQLFWSKISDFSLGRQYHEPESSRLGLGTVGYMAPETVRDRRTSAQSDLFALGIIAYQILTGRHPFMDEDTEPVKVNGRVCEQEPVALNKLRPELPQEIIAMVNTLLSKQEQLRPKSGWEVCRALQDSGAEYPYERALRPACLFRRDMPYDRFVAEYLKITASESIRVTELTDGKTDCLRLLLTVNFLRGRLVYESGGFRFVDQIYWPHRMRANTVRRFAGASWMERKATVIAAVAGGYGPYKRLELSAARQLDHLPLALPSLLLSLLRTPTVRRLSARLAPLADRLEAHDLAAQLQLQAGNIAEAERCTDLAARAFTNANDSQAALSLLLKLDRAARTNGREFEIRAALKLKANIHKDSGELDSAERTYRRVVAFYDTRPPDKLLAETYKYLGDLYRLRQNSKEALKALEKSLAVFRDLGDELEISHTLTNIGNVHWLGNDTRRALAHYRAAYKIQARLDAKADVASTLHNIASIFCLDGRLKRGIFLLQHSLRLKKEIGNLGEIARTLNNLGYACQLTGSPTKAAECLTEALEINRRIGSKKEILYNIENLISLKIAAGQLSDSAELLNDGLSIAQTQNLKAHEGPFHLHAATIAKRKGRYGEAAQSLAKVRNILTDLDDYSLGLLADVQTAGIRHQLGDSSSALETAGKVYCEAIRTKNSVAELESLLMLVKLTDEPGYWDAANGIVNERRLRREWRILRFSRLEYLLDNGQTDKALEMSSELLSELDDTEPDLERAWMHNVAGIAELNRQNRTTATSHFHRAECLAQESGLTPELITSLTMLGQISKVEGNFERAYAAFKQALRLCREVAEGIDNEPDRRLFLGRTVVQSLASEIKALGSRLGQKERADH